MSFGKGIIMTKIQTTRFLTYLIAFVFVLSFLTLSPLSNAHAAVNRAAGKLPTSSVAFTSLARVTDGDKNTNNYADSLTNSGLQWIQIDLGANYNVSSIKLWHYFGDTRKYRDVVVQLSNDPAFATGVTTVYNNDTNNSAGRGTGANSEYSETSAGLSIAVSNISARYARFYSNGSSANVYNHYVEVEIYGLQATVHPTSVSINKPAATIAIGSTDTLAAIFVPSGTTNKNVTWSTSDSNVAAVSSKGVVTGINPGTANITATTNDGKLQATCAVTVTTGKITGDKTAYANDNDNLETIYLTIMTGNIATMADVNNWTADMEVKPSLNVRFDYGTAASDLTGIVSNATFGPRGQGTSFAALKSYKIKLSDTATKWKSQKTINLNKHPYDITKVRNKLAFDLMKMFPDTFSLRTQFCRLYIRDLNSSNKQYVDYGLFTQVEEPNKDFLESRGIEKMAYFYKAEGFRFETYPDIIKNVTDPTYNKTEFEEILGIEGTEEHSRLIAMLKDVNDETQDINAVIDKWFDRDNYITWMAMNLLLNNTDTVDSNFFLLSPVDQEKWYFVPWDYDYSLGSINAPNADNSWMAPYMMNGISLYWGISMHRRFLEDPDNLAAVTAKLEELSTIATKAVVTDKVSKYYASTRAIVNRLPDTKVREGSLQVYENEIKRLSNVLDDAKEIYYDGFANPMPVVTKGVKVSGGQATFTWEEAYKFDNDTLRYDFTLSSDLEFNDIIDESTGMQGTSIVVDSLPAGTYYWKVEVYDTSGNRTMSVDNYREPVSHNYYFGIRQLIIN